MRELWLVDTPVSTVLVFRRGSPESVGFDEDAEVGPGDTLVSPLLPGFGARDRRALRLTPIEPVTPEALWGL